MGLLCGAPFLPLGYTFWCSVSTPELLVVALHQALFIISGFAFIIHSSPLTFNFPKRTIWHWLRPVLFYNLIFTLRWLIQQCLSAQPMISFV